MFVRPRIYQYVSSSVTDYTIYRNFHEFILNAVSQKVSQDCHVGCAESVDVGNTEQNDGHECPS
jgi:hypothetical protein